MALPPNEGLRPDDEIPVEHNDAGIPPRISAVRAQGRQMAQESQFTPLPPMVDVPHPPPHSSGWAGLGHAAASGLWSTGADVAGGLEYGANQMDMPGAAAAMQTGRQYAQNIAAQELSKLTPDEQNELGRSIFTLDPHKTIFQGGVSDTMHSIALQVAQGAPATLLTLLPAARLAKTAMGAMTYIGATQAGLSIGSIANGIADDIKNIPEAQLQQQSPRYSELLRSGMDPGAARQKLTIEAQGQAPLIGGIVTGAIAAAAGRILTPALVGEGKPFLQRMGRGAADQAIQGAGFASAERVAQDAAAQTYDRNAQGPSFGGTSEAALQGASQGALLGGVMGPLLGHGPGARPTEGAQGVPEEHHTSGPAFQREQPLGDVINRTAQNHAVYGIGEGGYRGADAENAGRPHFEQGNPQGQFDFGVDDQGVHDDQAAAVRSHFQNRDPQAVSEVASGGQPDMFAPPPWEAAQQQAIRQDQLPLRGGQMNPGPSAERGFQMQPTQRELPMRDVSMRQPPPVLQPEQGGIARMPPPEPSPGRAEQLKLFEPNLPEHPEDAAAREQLAGEQNTARTVRQQAEAMGAPAAEAAAQDEFGNRPATSEEAARGIVGEARKLYGEEQGRARWESTGEELPHPSDLVFPNDAKGRKSARYEQLYNEYAGTEILKRTAKDTGETLKAEVAQRQAARAANTYLHMNAPETNAERMARVAVGTDREAVRTALAEEREAGARTVEPRARVNTEAWEPGDRLTRGDVARLDPDQLQTAFLDAAQTEAAKAGVERSLQDIVESSKTPSEKRKFLNRHYSELRATEARGNVEGRTRSEPMAASPREAVSDEARAAPKEKFNPKTRTFERQERPASKRGYEVLPSEALMGTVESRAMMEESLKNSEARGKVRADLRTRLEDAIGRGENAHGELARVKAGENVNPAMARGYMRQLLQYGRALRETNLMSNEAIHAAQQYIGVMKKVNGMGMKARAEYLHGAFQTERQRQNFSAARAEPERTNFDRPTVQQLADLQSKRRGIEMQAPSASVTGTTNAARAIGARLEDGPARLGEVIDTALKHLTPDNPFREILQSLKNYGVEGHVRWSGPEAFRNETTSGTTRFDEDGAITRLNRAFFEGRRADGYNPSSMLLHTIAHEGVHVATVRALLEKPALRAEIDTLLRHAREALGGDSHYGLQDPLEFVAEGFANRSFQNALRTIQAPGLRGSLWEKFVDFVKRAVGLGEKSRTVLDALLDKREQLFSNEKYTGNDAALSAMYKQHGVIKTEGAKKATEMNLDHESEQKVGNLIDRAISSARIDEAVRNAAINSSETATRTKLGLMAPRQIGEAYSRYFVRPDGTNPLRDYFRNYFDRNAGTNRRMRPVEELSRSWSNLQDREGVDKAYAFSKLMHDASMYSVHPDLPVDITANEHLQSVDQKARHGELAKTYDGLSDDYKQLYQKLKTYYANSAVEWSDRLVLNDLRKVVTKGDEARMTPDQFDAKYSLGDVRRLQLNRSEGLERHFKMDPAGEDIARISKLGKMFERPNGPYFPLTRNGDYVVHAEKTRESKDFASIKDAQEYERKQKASDPTLSVGRFKHEDGSYTVNVVERETRMAETKSEALKHRQEMVAEYGEKSVRPVQLREALFEKRADITNEASLNRIIRGLDPQAQQAVKEFYLQTLADQSIRKRQLARRSIRGVDVGNQHRAFSQYGQTSSYYLSNLEYSHHLTDAMERIKGAVDNHSDESLISNTEMGAVAREIKERDDMTMAMPRPGRLMTATKEITQFAMMTSVSHLLVRGAQPHMLTTPWLAARHGLGDAVGAMARAQRLVASPLVREATSSWGGLKSLLGSNIETRNAAAKNASILDDVIKHVSTSGDAKAPEYVKLLEHLRDNGIVDVSMANELRDIAPPSSGRPGILPQRALNWSRAMLHVVEVNNRSMSGIAAYDLGRKKGMTPEQARDYAANAIAVTQNDYSYANTPRTFIKHPMATQFMRYVQNVYAMGLQAGADYFGRGRTPEEKAIAGRTLAGMLATHLAVAGALGVATQPVKWAAGLAALIASQMGWTDEPYSFANAVSGEAYNRMTREATNEIFGTDLGSVVSGGLPRLLGADVSQRMQLGNIWFVHMKTDSNEAILGSLAESFGGAWATEGEAVAKGVGALTHGDVAGAVEGLLPHFFRDIAEAATASSKGLVNNAGNTLIPAEQMTSGELFLKSIGINPARFADVQAAKAVETDVTKQLQARGQELTQKYVAADPDAKTNVWKQIQEFNSQHPGFEITRSSLIRAQQSKVQGDLQIQRYGARLRTRQIPEISALGAPYAMGPQGR